MKFQSFAWGSNNRLVNIGSVSGSVIVHGQRGQFEKDAEYAYLRWLDHDLRQRNLGDLTYVNLRAAEGGAPLSRSGDYAMAEDGVNRTHTHKVRQELRLLSDEIEGGEGNSARLTTVGANARLVWDVAALLENSRDPVILLGDPGSGKSTTLREIGVRMAQRGLKSQAPVIPIYVPLGGYRITDNDLVTDIMAVVQKAIPTSHPHIKTAFADLAATRRLAILFDSMDEMDRVKYSEKVERLSSFAKLYRGQARCLFACRTNDYLPSFAHRQVVLMPFNRRQVRSYIEHNFSLPAQIDGAAYSARALTNKLLSSHELGDTTTNPLTLFLIQQFVRRFKRWPKGRSELFSSYIDSVLVKLQNRRDEAGEETFSAKTLLADLSELAFNIAALRGGSYVEIGELENLWGEGRAKSCLTLGLQSGLLDIELSGEPLEAQPPKPGQEQDAGSGEDQAIEMGPKDTVTFFHHRIQEYLCAQHLIGPSNLLHSLDFEALIDGPRWQETLLHVVAARGLDIPPTSLITANLFDGARRIRENIDLKKELEAQKIELDQAIEEAGYTSDIDDEAKTTKLEAEEKLAQLDRHLQKLAWPLDNEEERTLANRSVLAARLLAEPQIGTSVENRQYATLQADLEASVRMLAANGRPTSQIKMLWAWRAAAGAIPRDAIDAPLRSPIGWVREQALLVFGSLASAHRSGLANLGNELVYDFLNGGLISQIRVYMKAANGRLSDQGLVAWAAFCLFIQIAVVISASIAAAALSWRTLPASVQSTLGHFGLSGGGVTAIIVVAAGFIALLPSGRGTARWAGWTTAITGCAAMAMAALPIALKISQKPFVPVFRPLVDIVPSSLLAGIVALSPGAVTSIGFALSVLLGFGLLRAPQLAHGRRENISAPAFALFPNKLGLEMLITIAFGGFILLAALFAASHVVIQFFSAFLAPYASILHWVGYGALGCVVIFLTFLVGQKSTRVMASVWLGSGAAIAAILYVSKLVAHLFHKLAYIFQSSWIEPWIILAGKVFSFVFEAIFAVAALIALVITFSIMTPWAKKAIRAQVDRLRFLGGIRSRSMQASVIWDKDALLAHLKRANPFEQGLILSTLNRQAVGLASTREFLALFETCEPFFAEDPALGIYWRRRHELEEATKQEMPAAERSDR